MCAAPWLVLVLVAAGLHCSCSVRDSASLVEDEAAILRRLRDVLAATDPGWVAPWRGWQPGDTTHHCQWDNIRCDAQRRVTAIVLHTDISGEAGEAASKAQHRRNPPMPAPGHVQHSLGGASLPLGGASLAAAQLGAAAGDLGAPSQQLALQAPLCWGALQPGLAQLQLLEVLTVGREEEGQRAKQLLPAPTAGMPPDWGAPGAFPRLKRLNINGLQLNLPLPDIQPGALPLLEELYLEAVAPHTLRLPASWGAGRATLPALRTLSLQAPLAWDSLPAEWARGFPCLRELMLTDGSPVTASSNPEKGDARVAASPGGAPPPAQLPPAWAQGFPDLTFLSISSGGGHLTGTLPVEWERGGFPALTELFLQSKNLTGPLPAALFEGHPGLEYLTLSRCAFSGPLPDAWAASRAKLLVLSDNLLTGPAFPRAWLAPDAFPALIHLELSMNLGLTGTLPDLPWPRLKLLDVHQTSLDGSIPDSWCQLPLAQTLQQLSAVGTGIAPRPPRCAHHAMHHTLFLPVVEPSGLPGASLPPHATGQTAPSAGRVATLVCAALALAALAGWVLRSARLKPRGLRFVRLSEEPGGEEEVALAAWRSMHSTHSGERSGGPPSSAPRLVVQPGNGGRERLVALLNSQLGGGAAPGQAQQRRLTMHVELLPLEDLPAAVAHSVGPQPPPQQAQRGGASQQPERARRDRAGGSGADGSSAPALSRRWGLDTDSLRLGVGELEFVLSKDGQLVELGRGAFAAVYMAKLQGRLVAVKVFELKTGMDSGVVWREVSLLRRVRHPRIVSLLGVALQGGLVLVAMEAMKGGTVRDALGDPQRRGWLRWAEWGRQVAMDVAEALAFLHSHNVVHSDCKAGNVLLTGDGRACLADLGVARVLAGSRSTAAAGFSSAYAAPELLLGGRVAPMADMYSFGILLIELFSEEQWEAHARHGRLPQAPDECPLGVVELILQCLSGEPAQRPSAAQALTALRAEAGA